MIAGKRYAKAPRKFTNHYDGSDGRFDDGSKECRHTNHHHQITALVVHAQPFPNDVQNPAKTRTDCNHWNKYAAGNPRPDVDGSDEEFQNENNQQRPNEGKPKHAFRRRREQLAAVRTQGLYQGMTAAHNADRQQGYRTAEQYGNRYTHTVAEFRVFEGYFFERFPHSQTSLIKAYAKQTAGNPCQHDEPVITER